MAMGIRESEQSLLWVAAAELPKSPGHPFYMRLNAVLDAHDFDPFVEGLCRGFYAQVMSASAMATGTAGRPVEMRTISNLQVGERFAIRDTRELVPRAEVPHRKETDSPL